MSNKNREDQKALQKVLYQIFKWSDNNNISFNYSKLNHINYSLKNQTSKFEYKINNFNTTTVKDKKFYDYNVR